MIFQYFKLNKKAKSNKLHANIPDETAHKVQTVSNNKKQKNTKECTLNCYVKIENLTIELKDIQEINLVNKTSDNKF